MINVNFFAEININFVASFQNEFKEEAHVIALKDNMAHANFGSQRDVKLKCSSLYPILPQRHTL